MTLHYYFNEYDDEGFEYDPEYSEIKDALKELPISELISEAEAMYDGLDKEEQQSINDCFKDSPHLLKPNGKVDFEKVAKEDLDWIIDELLFDNLEPFEDYLKDYFEDDALNAYSDYNDWKQDSYGGEWHDLSYYR